MNWSIGLTSISGLEHTSNVQRCSHEAKILSSKGDQIFMILLQGFIFFGTAHKLFNQIQKRIDDSSREKINFLVLDFRLVNGMDASAIYTFNRLTQISQKRGINLVFSGLKNNFFPDFRTTLEKNNIKIFPDLDRAIEWCENQIIQTALNKDTDFLPVVNEIYHWYTNPGSYAGKSSFLALFESLNPDESKQLLNSLKRITLEKNEVLFKKDHLPEAIYFLVSGQISIWIQIREKNTKRLRKFSAGTVIAEMSLYGAIKHRTTAIADEACQLYSLSREAMIKLERERPTLTNKFHKFIIDLLADRIGNLQNELKNLV